MSMDGNNKKLSNGRELSVYDFDKDHKMVRIVDRNGLTTETMYENDLILEMAKLVILRSSNA